MLYNVTAEGNVRVFFFFFFFLEQASYMSGITQPTAAPQKVRQEGHAT